MTLKLESHCACGASLELEAGDLSADMSLREIFEKWRAQHTPCAAMYVKRRPGL
jgi:hypothetical protein